MTDVLRFIFGNVGNAAGEATLEFLLAIACGRLRLQKRHVEDLLEFDTEDFPPLGRLLFRHVRRYPDQPVV